MKKIFKQTLSVMLVLIMSFSVTLPAFAESNELQTNPQTDISYESTNALGDLILDNYQETENESENAEYLIQSVTIEDKTATVELKNLDECTVVVAIYEKNGGKMLASGKADIEANESVTENTVSVTIDTDEMPEYFYVKAFLVDWENAPLCKYFETNEYTREFEEFMAKTTEDFEEDRVLNLDESEDNNFLVVSDDATVIEPEEGKNTVVKDDYTNGIYVIENADEQIKNLKKGDIFYYQYGEGKNDYIITKVENININGDAVTVIAQQEVEMTDYFQYVKIDTESSRTTFDGAEMDPDVVHETVEEMPRARKNISGEYSVSDKWTAKKDFGGGVSLQFSIKAKMTLGVKVYIDFDLFGEKYAYLEIILSCSSDIEFSLTGKVKVPPITLGVVGLDTDINEDFGINAAVKFVFIVEAKIAINVKVSMLDVAIGFAFDSKTGFVNKSKAGILDFETKVEEKATIFAGLALVPAVKITKHAKVDWKSQFGVEIDVTIPITSQEHECSLCAKIAVDFVASSIVNIKFFDWIERTTILGKLNIDIGKFYWSYEMGFGSGKCPNDSTTLEGEGSDLGGSDDENEEIRTVIDNGTCGENLIWTLYDDGELVIDGEGDMYNYPTKEPPWKSYANLIKNVKIGNGVTKIGDYSFYNLFTNIENLIIGDSVKIVGDYAFASAEKLKNIRFSNSITTIGNGAFSSCDGLVNITIPDSVSTIGSYSFKDCRNLKKVIFGDGLTTIPRSAFHYCTALTDIIIPDNITAIGYCSFMNCNIQNIYYSGTIEQWNEITIYANNDSVLTANIICSEMVSFMLLTPDNKISVYSANNIQSETITDALIGNDYVMIVVKDENAEDLLAPENLLYIDQKTADGEELTFEYVVDENITDYDILIFGQELPHFHAYNVVETAPTCTEQGFTTYTCSCGDTYIDDYVNATGHTDEVIAGYGATCTASGLTDGVKCAVCGTVTTAQTAIPAVSHADTDHDGLCDACDFDFTNGCSHTCHSDNAFMQFLWRIISFIQKLFGNKSAQYCDCGVAHW